MMTDSELGEKLLQDQEDQSDQENQDVFEKTIDSLTKESKPDDILTIIRKIADIENKITQEIHINRIHNRAGLSRRSLLKDLNTAINEARRKKQISSDAQIVHPAYDAKKTS